MNAPLALLLGGTSETAPLATALAESGWRVLVSTATTAPLDCGRHARIEKRSGPLDQAALAALIRARAVRALVDAAHPYAEQLHRTALAVARETGIFYLRWRRRPTDLAEDAVEWAADHAEAARRAFAWGRPVLLTTGSRHLTPYVEQAHQRGIKLAVRVLPHPDSLAACHAAGLVESQIIAARGPFSVEENRTHIRRFGAGVLVTKDGGEPGGVSAKLEAARLADCRVVMLRRPAESAETIVERTEDLLALLEPHRNR